MKSESVVLSRLVIGGVVVTGVMRFCGDGSVDDSSKMGVNVFGSNG